MNTWHHRGDELMLKALASRIEMDFESYDPKARDIASWPQEGWVESVRAREFEN